jgi:transcription termination factor Rho
VRVNPDMVTRFGLQLGHEVTGPARYGGRGPLLIGVTKVHGQTPEEARRVTPFNDCLAVHPHKRLRLETGKEPFSTRLIDLLVPLGMGSRGLIIAPPRAGKTTILHQMAVGIHTNHPEVDLFLLLLDERPEEVTEFRRLGAGTVVASSFDAEPEIHRRIAEMTMHHAHHLAERGRDVVILCDSLTRLARANNLRGGSGRTGTGGLDINALRFPRMLFGAARAIDGGGSLTIIATVLVETGSRMDDVIFEEFKGTGNWEMRLDRRLAEQRLYPAVDILASGTRKEELLYDETENRLATVLRRILVRTGSPDQALRQVIDAFEKTPSNAALLQGVAALQGGQR